mmetsp:Transcript_8796/g.18420  ORF Transcript_8796/g.18420 Transcript_8796/m.18420 type:complete len:434 (+) Transcript_8796:149-1450(+)
MARPSPPIRITTNQVKLALFVYALLSISSVFRGICTPQPHYLSSVVVQKHLRDKSHEICTRRHRQWNLNFDQIRRKATKSLVQDTSLLNASEATTNQSHYLFVVTVNDGFFDFFLNWHGHFERTVSKSTSASNDFGNDGNDENNINQHYFGNIPVLIIIAEDLIVYEKLSGLYYLINDVSVIILLSESAAKSGVPSAEDYDSYGYKTLVSSRATHLLDITCELVRGRRDALNKSNRTSGHDDIPWVIVYSDVDTVFLKNPIPYVEAKLFETVDEPNKSPQATERTGLTLASSNRSQRLSPSYDIVSSVDNINASGFEFYYCTGFFAINPTPASVVFFSQWEKELQAYPRLNQPVFNDAIRVPLIGDATIRHAPLKLHDFPSGRLFFETWEKEIDPDFASLKKSNVVVVHNNYIIGHDAKKKRFLDRGLWLLRD